MSLNVFSQAVHVSERHISSSPARYNKLHYNKQLQIIPLKFLTFNLSILLISCFLKTVSCKTIFIQDSNHFLLKGDNLSNAKVQNIFIPLLF